MKKIFLTMVFLFLTFSLFSVDFNIGVYGDSDFNQLIENIIPKVINIGDKQYEWLQEINYNNDKISLETSLHSAWESEVESNIIAAQKLFFNLEKKDFNKDNIDVVVKDLNEKPNLTKDFCLNNNLSIVFEVKSDEISGYEHIAINVYSPALDEKFIVKDSLKIKSEQNDYDFSGLCKFLNEGYYGILKINTPGDYRIDLNGERIATKYNFVILPKGVSTFVISSPGYVNKIINFEIEPCKTNILDVILQSEAFSSFNVSCEQGFSTVFSSGKEIGTTPFFLSDIQFPIELTFEKEGFKSEIVNIEGKTEQISISLIPENINEIEEYNMKRKKFYNSLGYTFLSFGLYLASGVVDQPFIQGINLGVSCILFANTISNLIDYYNVIKYILPQGVL